MRKKLQSPSCYIYPETFRKLESWKVISRDKNSQFQVDLETWRADKKILKVLVKRTKKGRIQRSKKGAVLCYGIIK